MGLIGNLFSRMGGAGGPQAIAATAPATAGVAYTLSRLLGSTSTLSLISGTNGNLTLSGAQISQASAIVQGSSQTAVVREYDSASQRAVEYPVMLAGTAAAPTVVALPAGAVAIWDAASLSALADGAAVSAWTDAIGGIATTQSGTPHTYVANSGGLPAVRLSGAGLLSTSGTNAANTALTSGERTLIVVARNILNSSGNPCLVSSGDSNMLIQANASTTGKYGLMLPCADAGVRTIAISASATAGSASAGAPGISLTGINGTAIAAGPIGGGGQVYIGGWTDGYSLGKADVLAVLVYKRALTAAELKTVHRHYCEAIGQARPAGRNVTFIGDSLTAGYPVGLGYSYPYQMAQALGLPWGTWDQMGYSGDTWINIKDRALPLVGNVSGATGRTNILCMFEFANMRGSSGSVVASAAQTTINAARAQDSNLDVILATSTDDGSSAGVNTRQNRRDYNAALIAGLNGVTTLVRLDLDANIGVEGAAPTNQTANTYYQSDDLHLTQAGYALVDNGLYGFRSAVQARLAA